MSAHRTSFLCLEGLPYPSDTQEIGHLPVATLIVHLIQAGPLTHSLSGQPVANLFHGVISFSPAVSPQRKRKENRLQRDPKQR